MPQLPTVAKQEVLAPMLSNTANLKIMIVSTSKTGNTWLKYLLAAIYDLPIKDLPMDYSDELVESFGDRWIAHQHYFAFDKVVKWATENNVVLISTIRHPGDVLVSLYHYIRSDPGHPQFFAKDVELVMLDGGKPAGVQEKTVGKHITEYVKRYFHENLDVSLQWMRKGITRMVRYEDLWCNPVEVLRSLTNQIYPVSQDALERAIDQCDIKLLRKQVGYNKNLIRKGGIGGWVEALPPEVIGLFRTYDPYPAYFKELGYSLDPNDPVMTKPVLPRDFDNPFRHIDAFDNGVAVAPVLIRVYLTFPSEVSRQWRPIEKTSGPHTYFNWLNAPADLDPERDTAWLVVTNLAAFIYNIRPDLQQTYPEPFGKDREGFVEWFSVYGGPEYQLDPAFYNLSTIFSVQSANLPREKDSNSTGLPTVSQYAEYVYRRRPDLMENYPDIFGSDRVPFLLWFTQSEDSKANNDSAFIKPVSEKLQNWFKEPASEDPNKGNKAMVPLSNYALYVYQQRPDIVRNFPDVYNKDRIPFASWFINRLQVEELQPFEVELGQSFQELYFKWAKSPAISEEKLPVSNYAMFIYQFRKDVQNIFSNLQNENDRLGYLRWFCDRATLEHGTHPEIVKNVEENLQQFVR
ncbi:MAG TPA: sulfotransferase domain-containing protein [Chloroflexia bacterium]|nr:sulfotransferase domain-containing protein [Chloroflexia bacterium]